MNSQNLLKATQAFVEDLFENQLSKDFVYHDLQHTLTVRHYCEVFGKEHQLSEKDMFHLQLAALLHDTGYTRTYEGHEEASVEIALEFLRQQASPDVDLERITQLIRATIPANEPVDLLDKIIKDADLSTVGNEDFEKFSDNLRKEWKVICKENYTNLEWYQNNVEFLKQHQFFSEPAQKIFSDQKKTNLKKMKKRLKKENKKMKKKGKKAKDVKSAISGSRSAQMMFKTALRNHIDLTNIADSKSGMMLSVNAIVISITIPLLASVIQEHPYMGIPSTCLLLTCVMTIVFATLATRPITMTGLTDFEKIRNGRTNLFFFGNFYQMDLEKYHEGLNLVISDEEILENTIVNDLYYLGKALGDKYAKLRICYGIFMIGIITTVIAFAITFFLSGSN